jgi:DNA ligase-1
MLAKLFDRNKVKYPCFASPKIDGVRAIFKNGKFYSRNGHEYQGLDHLQEDLITSSINEVLDGELTVVGKSFQEGSGLIRNSSDTPDAQFHIFDIPSLKVPFMERLIAIQDIKYSTNSWIQSVHHMDCANEDVLMNFYDSCRSIGYEGAVVKPLDYQYKGTRSYDWMKLKPTETVDLKVIDLFEGKGKYKGQMGGAIVNYKGKLNKVGSGWSDSQRQRFWDSPDLILNCTIEVDFMEETDDGNMRHARFKRFRPDKD